MSGYVHFICSSFYTSFFRESFLRAVNEAPTVLDAILILDHNKFKYGRACCESKETYTLYYLYAGQDSASVNGRSSYFRLGNYDIPLDTPRTEVEFDQYGSCAFTFFCCCCCEGALQSPVKERNFEAIKQLLVAGSAWVSGRLSHTSDLLLTVRSTKRTSSSAVDKDDSEKASDMHTRLL